MYTYHDILSVNNKFYVYRIYFISQNTLAEDYKTTAPSYE